MLISTKGYSQVYYPVDLEKAIRATPLDQWAQRFEVSKRAIEDFNVESLEEFIKINEYYEAFLNDGKVTHSFRTKYNEQIHCVEIASQASIKAAGLDPGNLPLAPLKVPAEFANKKRDSSGSIPLVDFGLDGSLDENGQARKCPEGSFPKLIRPLETFYKFKTLQDIFRKYPAGHRPLLFGFGKSETKESHEYTVVYDVMNHTGEIADFNIWSPDVAPANEFSLGQLWVARGDGSDLQTVELGWQVYPYFYGNYHANLFIFFTPDNYQTGCYNLDCAGFVQTDPSVVIGGGFPNYSSIDGTQYHVTLGFLRDDGGSNHWWLRYDDTWVGYYPNGIFDNQGIAQYSDNINLGGELVDSFYGGNHTETEMGSGLFPHEGYGRAAFIKKIQYVDMSDNLVDASYLYPYATVPSCWNISQVDYSSDVNWSTNFYFGGACDQNPDDDDDDDDNDDNDNNDNNDNDADDDSDDDNDANENNSEDCLWLIDLTYIDCGLQFLDTGKVIPTEGAYQLCLEAGDSWDCIFECARDETVTDCSVYSSCLAEKCQITLKETTSNDNEEDEEKDECCG